MAGNTLILRLGAASVCLVLGGCGTLLPHETENAAQDFFSYDDVQFYYSRVVPHITPESELPRFGFHIESSPNVQIVNYLGVMNRFMPNDTISINDVDPSVRQCIEKRADCTGYVFRLEHREEQRVGSVALDMLSFRRETVTSGWWAEVIFLVDDGLVIYKLLSGSPNVDERRNVVRPLGPLQDVSGVARGAVTP
jgi:hypothetical protein